MAPRVPTCDADAHPFTPTLVVIGADSSLRVRIGAASFSFVLRFQNEVPRERRFDEASLVPFPEGATLIARFPRRYPVIGFGSISSMADAFAIGVADYLAEPWSLEEFQLRVERVLGEGPLILKGTEITLRGLVLTGPRGKVFLSAEQAAFLRRLIIAEGEGLSRGMLRRFLWPSLGEDSRAVDITASRLRRQIDRVCGGETCVQLRSVRGFGYSLAALDSLCGSCE
jgi:hypothetical protein